LRAGSPILRRWRFPGESSRQSKVLVRTCICADMEARADPVVAGKHLDMAIGHDRCRPT
jgi:hypothetical protein